MRGMNLMVKQKIEYASGADVPTLSVEIQKKTEKLNKEGFELTFVAYQSNDNKAYHFSTAIMIFTEK